MPFPSNTTAVGADPSTGYPVDKTLPPGAVPPPSMPPDPNAYAGPGRIGSVVMDNDPTAAKPYAGPTVTPPPAPTPVNSQPQAIPVTSPAPVVTPAVQPVANTGPVVQPPPGQGPPVPTQPAPPVQQPNASDALTGTPQGQPNQTPIAPTTAAAPAAVPAPVPSQVWQPPVPLVGDAAEMMSPMIAQQERQQQMATEQQHWTAEAGWQNSRTQVQDNREQDYRQHMLDQEQQKIDLQKRQDANAAATEDQAETGRRYVMGPGGVKTPISDPATGAPLYTPAKLGETTDDDTGRPTVQSRDMTGKITSQTDYKKWDADDAPTAQAAAAEDIKSPDLGTKINAAKYLHGKEIEQLQTQADNLQTQIRNPDLPKPLKPELLASLTQQAKDLSVPIPPPQSKSGLFGSVAPTQDEIDTQRELEAERVASLAKVQEQLQSNDDRKTLVQQALDTQQKLRDSKAQGPGGFLRRYQSGQSFVADDGDEKKNDIAGAITDAQSQQADRDQQRQALQTQIAGGLTGTDLDQANQKLASLDQTDQAVKPQMDAAKQQLAIANTPAPAPDPSANQPQQVHPMSAMQDFINNADRTLTKSLGPTLIAGATDLGAAIAQSPINPEHWIDKAVTALGGPDVEARENAAIDKVHAFQKSGEANIDAAYPVDESRAKTWTRWASDLTGNTLPMLAGPGRLKTAIDGYMALTGGEQAKEQLQNQGATGTAAGAAGIATGGVYALANHFLGPFTTSFLKYMPGAGKTVAEKALNAVVGVGANSARQGLELGAINGASSAIADTALAASGVKDTGDDKTPYENPFKSALDGVVMGATLGGILTVPERMQIEANNSQVGNALKTAGAKATFVQSVADGNLQIDQAVASGKMTQPQADQAKRDTLHFLTPENQAQVAAHADNINNAHMQGAQILKSSAIATQALGQPDPDYRHLTDDQVNAAIQATPDDSKLALEADRRARMAQIQQVTGQRLNEVADNQKSATAATEYLAGQPGGAATLASLVEHNASLPIGQKIDARAFLPVDQLQALTDPTINDPQKAADALTAQGRPTSPDDIVKAQQLAGHSQNMPEHQEITEQKHAARTEIAVHQQAGNKAAEIGARQKVVALETKRKQAVLQRLGQNVQASREIDGLRQASDAAQARAEAAKGQPKEVSEPAQQAFAEAKQKANRASGVAKISNGVHLSKLTAGELAAVGAVPDGTGGFKPAVGVADVAKDPTKELSPVTPSKAGTPIVTDEGARNLAKYAPQTAKLIYDGETDAKTKADARADAAAQQGAKEQRKETAGKDVREKPEGGSWTARGDAGTEVSIPRDDAKSQREAEPLLARKLPKGELLDVGSVEAPPKLKEAAKPEKPADEAKPAPYSEGDARPIQSSGTGPAAKPAESAGSGHGEERTAAGTDNPVGQKQPTPGAGSDSQLDRTGGQDASVPRSSAPDGSSGSDTVPKPGNEPAKSEPGRVSPARELRNGEVDRQVSGIKARLDALNRSRGLTGDRAIKVIYTDDEHGSVTARFTPDGKIAIFVNKARVENEANSYRFAYDKGDANKWLSDALNEEVIHVADMITGRDAWEAAGNPGDANKFWENERAKDLATVRVAIAGGNKVIARAFVDSFNSYGNRGKSRLPKAARDIGDEDINKIALKLIDHLTSTNRDLNQTCEFIRQLIQAKNEGNLTEIGYRNAVGRLLDWMKKIYENLQQAAFESPELAAILKPIEDVLDMAKEPPVSVSNPIPEPESKPTVERTPEIQAKVDGLKKVRDRQIGWLKDQLRRGVIFSDEYGRQAKGIAMRTAAEIRQVTGELTDREAHAKRQKEAGNYSGKPVSVDGKNATVVNMVFGKVRVKFNDGTTGLVEPDKIAAPQEFAPMSDEEIKAQDQSRKDALKTAFEDRPTLLQMVKQLGGVATTDQALQGELNSLKEAKNKGTMMQLFRKDGLLLDALREALAEKGFHFDHPSQMVEAINDSIKSGKPIYGAGEARLRAGERDSEKTGLPKATPGVGSGHGQDQLAAGNRPNEGTRRSSEAQFRTAADVARGHGQDVQGVGSVAYVAKRDAEAAALTKWATDNGKLLPADYFADKTLKSAGTAEHKVYEDASGRIIKQTNGGFYGQIPVIRGDRIERLPATPSEYLDRARLQNQVFHDNLKLEGIKPERSLVLGEGELPTIVTSQGKKQPLNPDKPHPSDARIAERMKEEGFLPSKNKDRVNTTWYRPEDGILVGDAKADNFILDKNNVVVPIDLQMSQVDPKTLPESWKRQPGDMQLNAGSRDDLFDQPAAPAKEVPADKKGALAVYNKFNPLRKSGDISAGQSKMLEQAEKILGQEFITGLENDGAPEVDKTAEQHRANIERLQFEAKNFRKQATELTARAKILDALPMSQRRPVEAMQLKSQAGDMRLSAQNRDRAAEKERGILNAHLAVEPPTIKKSLTVAPHVNFGQPETGIKHELTTEAPDMFGKKPEGQQSLFAGTRAQSEALDLGLYRNPGEFDLSAKPEPDKKNSTQINMPSEKAKQFTDYAKSIPDADLYHGEEGTDSYGPDYGREDKPHVTVHYGLESDPVAVQKLVKDFGPIKLKLGKTSLFKNDKYDVLKVGIEGSDIHRLNGLLAKEYPVKSDFPDYKPHLTIAYLKKGEGDKYAGDDRFEGQEVPISQFVFSDKERNHIPVDLNTDEGKKPGSLVMENRGLAKAIAAKYNIPGVERSDIIQIANKGLIKAAQAYDPKTGSKFSTYAYRVMSNELNGVYGKQVKIAEHEEGTLNEPIAENGATREEVTPDAKVDKTLPMERSETSKAIDDEIRKLPKRPQAIVEGIREGKNGQEIADELGISRQAVNDSLHGALTVLRQRLKARGFEGHEDGILYAGDREKYMDELMRQIRADMPSQAEIDNLRKQAIAEPAGKQTIGEPRKANYAQDRDTRRGIDAIQDLAESRREAETQQGWIDEARTRVQRDPEAVKTDLLKKAFDPDVYGTFSPVDVKSAQLLIPRLMREAYASGDKTKIKEASALAWAYDAGGTEQARAFSARRDPFKTPAERHIEFLTKMISTPSPRERAEIRNEPDAGKRKEMLEKAQSDRLEKITKALGDMGVRLEDVFAGEAKVSLKSSMMAQNALSKLGDPVRQKAARMIMDGYSDPQIAKQLNLKPGDVKDLSGKFDQVLGERLADFFGRGFTPADLENMDASKLFAGERDPVRKVDLSLEQLASMVKEGLRKFRADPELRNSGKLQKRLKRRVDKPMPYEGKGPSDAPIPGYEPMKQDVMKPGLTPDEQAEFNRTRKPDISPADAARYKQAQDMYDKEMPYEHVAFDPNSKEQVFKLARTMQAVDGNKFDMMYEAWVNSILSGPQTHVALSMGMAANAAWDFSVQRGIEALTNAAFFHDPNSAQFGEFKPMLKAVIPAVTRGLKFAAKVFNSEEHYAFERSVMNQQMEFKGAGDVTGGHLPAIPGKAGRIIRLPARVVMFQDSFFKQVIGQMEASAQAYRLGKAQGLAGADLENYIHGQVNLPGSDAWQRAVSKAEEGTFQTALRSHAEGGGPAEGIARKVQDLRNGNASTWQGQLGEKMLGFLFPFIRTPYNIFRTGLSKTPLGGVAVAGRITDGLFALKDGKPFVSGYSKAQMVKDLATQTIAWSTAAMLYGMVEGDKDDENKQFLITGSRPHGVDKEGSRDLANRVAGGPYQIRIGGRNGTYINYGRIEPFATVLGTVADAMRIAKQGQDLPTSIGKFGGYFMAQVQDKTFLQGISSVAEAVQTATQDPKNVAKGVERQFLQGLVPNLIRQPLRNLDDYERDTRNAGAGYAMTAMGGLAPKKYDLYGNAEMKQGNPLSRIVARSGDVPTSTLVRGDSFLENWNRTNPDQPFFPARESNYTYKDAAGKKVAMTPSQIEEFDHKAGKTFAQSMNGWLTPQMAKAPTEEGVKTFKEELEKARKATKDEMFGGGLARKPTQMGTDISTLMGWK